MFVKDPVMANPRSFAVSSSASTKARSGVFSQTSAIRPAWLQVTSKCRTLGYLSSAASSTANPSELSPDRENEIHKYGPPRKHRSSKLVRRSVLGNAHTSHPHKRRSKGARDRPT